MNVLTHLVRLARALDTYPKDKNPDHWKTINGAKVHLDKNGNYDGGAGGRFTGRHHYGPDWKQKLALMNRLAAALHGAVSHGQAQGNAAGQNIASKATNGVAGSGIISPGEEEKIIANIQKLSDATEKAEKEQGRCLRAFFDSNYAVTRQDVQRKYSDAAKKYQDALAKENKARDEATAKGIPLVSQGWRRIERELSMGNIAAVAVSRHTKKIPEEGIIRRISGGDKTKGSCASVALAYIANKFGLNVLDFRGGKSREFFAEKWIKRAMLDFPGIKGKCIEIHSAPASTGAAMLLGLENDKEYYLSFGRHASIVKNTDEGVKYLELQNPFTNKNGWQLMGNNKKTVSEKLKSRFGAKVRAGSQGSPLTLLEVDSFKGNREFEKMVEYFNTNAEKQEKGVYGSVK